VSKPERPDVEGCPSCGETSGVEMFTDTLPKVQAWSCRVCGTDWAFTKVNLQMRPRPWRVQLAENLATFTVLQEITTLPDQADTLTDDQVRARLINCWARLDQICRRSVASGFPAGHRSNNEVPGAPPVSDPAVTAAESTSTGIIR
jgi:hypothetical protein